MKETKILLNEKEIPRYWYNIQAICLILKPPLSPTTDPATPDELSYFPDEVTNKKERRDILRYRKKGEIYKLWRPSPVFRAHRLEKALDTPAKIYFKYEGVSPAGSHKLNTAIPQAYYNKQQGIKRLSTETGAGQWGTALAMACSFFGMECTVYMVNVSYNQKPYRRSMMELFGAQVLPAPAIKWQVEQ